MLNNKILLIVFMIFLGQSLSMSIDDFKNKETSSYLNFNPTMASIILKSPMSNLRRDTSLLEKTEEKDVNLRILRKVIRHKILTILQRLIELQKRKEDQRVFWYLRQGR